RRGSKIRPRANASQRAASVRVVPAHAIRRPPRRGPHRPRALRRSDQCPDPLREKRARMVRVAAVAPGPVAAALHSIPMRAPLGVAAVGLALLCAKTARADAPADL